MVDIKLFKEGIFSLNTRRFGKLAEIMIKKKYGLSNPGNNAHDLYDHYNNNKIEVKFSTVLKKCKDKINEKNVISQILEANLENRTVEYKNIQNVLFDCNIQQIKRVEFDEMYYGCFFDDKIMICKIKAEKILDCYGYSDFQHLGNEGEGQFHINNDSIDYHIKNHLIEWITYEDLYNILSN